MVKRFVLGCLLFFALDLTAATCVRDQSIEKALTDLSLYSDVTTALDCKSASHAFERLICKNSKLIRLSELDARAQVFGLENAMGQQVEHKQFKDEGFEKATLSACKDDDCICKAFVDHIQAAFPEFSP